MKTGPGSNARYLAYHIDALILARLGQVHSLPELAKDKNEKFERALDALEKVIGQTL